ncbi:MAG: BT_3044 domain-containing protein, partial [Draconibacterium sp.]
QHGNYYYSGRTIRKSTTETDTVVYENNPTITESIRELITIGPNSMKVKADNSAGSKDPGVAFNISAPLAGSGEVSLSSDDGAAIQVSGNGTSMYDAEARTFYLKYKYTDGDYECEAADTLVFRNRVRDIQSDGQGVNEWR